MAVVASACFFAASTVAVKFVGNYGMPPMTIAFGRFALGALIFGLWFLLKRRRWPRPVHKGHVLGRAVSNLLAVIALYYGLALTTVSKANILNLTYPVFVALLSPWLLGERASLKRYGAVTLGFVGIVLIIRPDFSAGINIGDLLALASGVVAAFSVLALRKAREYDATDTIVFYLMALGALVLAPAAPWLAQAAPHHLGIWFVSSLLGVAAQVTITMGYRYLAAIDASIASTTQIVMAALLGSMFFAEPITAAVVAGAALILLAITLIASESRQTANAQAGAQT